MPRPNLIVVGDRVLNLEAVRYLEIEGPHLVNVFITGRNDPLQFTGPDAHTLIDILNSGYVFPLVEPDTPAEES